jgi:hypothetical protein
MGTGIFLRKRFSNKCFKKSRLFKIVAKILEKISGIKISLPTALLNPEILNSKLHFQHYTFTTKENINQKTVHLMT